MKEVIVSSLNSVNIEKLDADLRSALAARYLGLSIRRGDVIVFMAEATASEDVLEAEQVVVNHDSSLLTAEQAAEIAEQDALDAARISNAQAVNLSDYDASDALIRNLAQKIEWLELEIRDLRGL